MQNDANRRAKNQADRSLAMQDRLAMRQIALFDRIQARHQELASSGAFSPERRLDQLDRDTAKYEGRDSGNLAGALRVAGYEPGDSEIGTRLDAVKAKYRGTREGLANQIRREATADEMASLNGQAGAGSSLNAAMDVYGNRASQFAADIGSLDPAVGSLGTALSDILKRKSGSSSSSVPLPSVRPVIASRIPVTYGGNWGYRKP